MVCILLVKVFSNTAGSGADTASTLSDSCTTTDKRYVIATDATFTNGATVLAAIFENTQLESGASGNTITGISSAKMDVATLDSSNVSSFEDCWHSDDVENEDFTCWHSYDCDA